MRELTKKRPGVVVVVDIFFLLFLFLGSRIGDKEERGVEYFSFLVVVRMIMISFLIVSFFFVYRYVF